MGTIVLHTNGGGYWSEAAKPVEVVDMQLGYIADEKDFGELRVYFNTDTWNVREDGLIYTDRQFERELREFLDSHGLPGKDVSYSEQGMQGNDYVSLDIGEKFLTAWARKFGTNLDRMLEDQAAAFAARWG